jgi:phage tail protein X
MPLFGKIKLDPRPVLECGKCGTTKRATIQDGAKFLQNTRHHVNCAGCGGVMWVQGRSSGTKSKEAVMVDAAKEAVGIDPTRTASGAKDIAKAVAGVAAIVVAGAVAVDTVKGAADGKTEDKVIVGAVGTSFGVGAVYSLGVSAGVDAATSSSVPTPSTAPKPHSISERTLANSKFKAAYANASAPNTLMKLGLKLGDVIKHYCSEENIPFHDDQGERFFEELQADMKEEDSIVEAVQRMWTSYRTLRGREVCFMLNQVTRDDAQGAVASAAALTRAINQMCVTGGVQGHGAALDSQLPATALPERHRPERALSTAPAADEDVSVDGAAPEAPLDGFQSHTARHVAAVVAANPSLAAMEPDLLTHFRDHETRITNAAESATGANADATAPTTICAVHPPDNLCYRGGGFDDRCRDFFVAGREFRQPAFLATSFSEETARKFLRMRGDGDCVLWLVRIDPERKCRHVNLVTKCVPGLADEQEYLFAPYSAFTVLNASWKAGTVDDPHAIELMAAVDNKAASEDLPLAPWS